MNNKKTAAAATAFTIICSALTSGLPMCGANTLSSYATDPACKDIDPLDYTYEIYPLVEPFNEYFYVRTDNPNPESFRFSDKDSPYSATSVIYNDDNLYADVEYENEDILRVNGGYIFKSYSTDGGKVTLQVQQPITRAEFNTEVYGEPDPKTTGYSPYHGMPVGTYKEYIGSGPSYYIAGYYRWTDTDVSITLPELCDDCDYLIQNYATKDSFFENMDAVQAGFSSICLYSGSFIRGEIYRSGDRDWHLTLGFHVDQSFYIYSPYSRRDNKSLLASALYPYRYDSLGFPGMMGAVSKRLSDESTYEWSSTSHAYINVTYDGTTKSYGGAGHGEGQGISEDKLVRKFSFGDNDESLTLEDARELLTTYASVEMEDDIPRDDELTWKKIYDTVGDGAWVDMGGYYTYLYQRDDRSTFSADEWGVGNSLYWGGSLGYCNDTWVDGRYIKKDFIKGVTFDEHPESSVLLTEVTVPVITELKQEWDSVKKGYKYTSAAVETTERKNVLFRYDKTEQVWKANIAWGEYYNTYDTFKMLTENELIDSKYLQMLTLTREEVEDLISNGKTNEEPAKGYIYDGYSPQGTPYVKGDCNNDGSCTIADAVLLQKWLLGTQETELANWRNVDLVTDRRIDSFDLCRLRRMLVE